jgi:aryl-alcohol dehydrogenase-like predicted oxidoreductase
MYYWLSVLKQRNKPFLVTRLEKRLRVWHNHQRYTATVIEGRATAQGTRRRFDPNTLSIFVQQPIREHKIEYYISQQLNVRNHEESLFDLMNRDESSESIARRTLHPQLYPHLRHVTATDWTISRLGFGAYRTGRTATHRRALVDALSVGVNLIDTSANYMGGESEEMIGETLSHLIQNLKILRRDEIVVISKAGYMQGESLRLAQQRRDEGHPYSEVVEIFPELWYCISPDFLHDQLTRSLQRLRLQTLDVFLLHNPEYLLYKYPGASSDLYEKIEKAFAYLEDEVKVGRIQYYGVSSNSLPLPPTHPRFISVETLYQLARKVSSQHHFAVVQYPCNLVESQPLWLPNHDKYTLHDTARQLGLMQITNRPFNAIVNDSLFRLVDTASHSDKDIIELCKQILNVTLTLEKEYHDMWQREYAHNKLWAHAPSWRDVSWAHILLHNQDTLSNLPTYREALDHQILPSLRTLFNNLEYTLRNIPALRLWFVHYKRAMETLLIRYQWLLETNQYFQLHYLKQELDNVLSAASSSALASTNSSSTSSSFSDDTSKQQHTSISQLAIQSMLSSEVDCTLVGMRHPMYVQRIMEELTPTRFTEEQLVQLGRRAWDVVNELVVAEKRSTKKYVDTPSSSPPATTN